MRRREFLLAAAGTPFVSGCMALEAYREPPACQATEIVDNPPEGTVYMPTHRDGMVMLGSDTAGGYKVSFSYTYPHQFWTVTGDRAEFVDLADGDDAHLMATVRDAETGVPLPVDTGASLEILDGGETVFERGPWTMVSQTMGFHLGDNVPFDGDGEYVARLSLGEPDARLTGSFGGRFEEGGTAEVEFEYARSERDDIGCEEIDEEERGTPGGRSKPCHTTTTGMVTVPRSSR